MLNKIVISLLMERKNAIRIRYIYNICNNNKHLQHSRDAGRGRLLQD
jgi:hypothetical protein